VTSCVWDRLGIGHAAAVGTGAAVIFFPLIAGTRRVARHPSRICCSRYGATLGPAGIDWHRGPKAIRHSVSDGCYPVARTSSSERDWNRLLTAFGAGDVYKQIGLTWIAPRPLAHLRLPRPVLRRAASAPLVRPLCRRGRPGDAPLRGHHRRVTRRTARLLRYRWCLQWSERVNEFADHNGKPCGPRISQISTTK
jgi:hypothetical protein